MPKVSPRKPVARKVKTTKTPAKGSRVRTWLTSLNKRRKDFLARRPHRSFYLTRRRDYVHPSSFPGYWAFTREVAHTLRANKKSFFILGGIYFALSLLLFGLASQEDFSTLRETIAGMGEEVFRGDWSSLKEASLVALSAVAGNVAPALTGGQQVLAILMGLIVWLSTVWLLRQRIAGNRVNVRDSLYNSGAPIVATAMLTGVLVVQLLPIALAIVGYGAATASGLLEGGVESMLFWMAAIGLVVLSLYWMISTLVALIIVTLPGMYPMRALSVAGDMVSGRRLKVLFKVLWMIVVLLLLWVAFLTSTVLFDTWLVGLLPGADGIPLVPVVILLLTTATLIIAAAYVYLLYRTLVDDDTTSA